MNDTPQAPPPKDAAAKVPAPRKPGLFARLFGLGGLMSATTGDHLNVAITPFLDAAQQNHARTIASVLQKINGLRIRILREPPLLRPSTYNSDDFTGAPSTADLPDACAKAMTWLGKFNVDLVLWGDVPPPGTTLFIYFAAPPPSDSDPCAIISPFQPLNLPVEFNPDDFAGLLLATALAAMNLQNDTQRQKRRTLIADALGHAATNMENLPSDFTLREKAAAHAAYANALATFGHLFPGGEVYHRAALAYEQALKGVLRTDSPTNWAYLNRNLGAVRQALGERADDIDLLEHATTAYRAALEVFTFEATPFPWATTQNRLGEVLYRLDIKSGDTAGLKEALTVYQAALKVLNRKSTPLLWAQTMNNLAQAAQILGRELSNPELVERAVTACVQALKVRTHDHHPTLWATTQNNMGSALFLLGLMSGEDKYNEKALNAFMDAREIYSALGLTRMVEVTDKNIQHARARMPGGGEKTKKNDPAMWWLEEDTD